MMRLLITLVLLNCIFVGFSQQYLPEYMQFDTTTSFLLKSNYEAGYHTSSVPNSFLSYFINGGFIDEEAKNKVSNKLDENNTIGAQQAFSLRLYDFKTHPFKDKDWAYYFNLEHQEHLSLNFTKTMFDLAFYGNGNYVGQELQLAPVNITHLKYQKIGFGLLEMTSGTSLGISLVKGQTLNYLDFSNAVLHTDDSTANIDFAYQTQIARSDSAKTNWTAFNGTGMAIDITWNFKFLSDSILPDLTRWQIKVNNAGFLVWNTATLNYQADSAIQYNGFQVNSLLQPDEALLNTNIDIKDTLNVNFEKKRFPVLLPMDVTLGNYVNPLSGFWLKPLVGFRYKLMEGYKPMFYAGASVKLAKRSFLQCVGSYGGFGGLRVNLRLQTILGKHLNLLVGSSSIDGAYSGARFAKDIYAGLWFRF